MPYSIVIVDDDAEMLQRINDQLGEIIRRSGIECTIHVLSSPADMDDIIYDAYFLDISMPLIDGIELARNIRDRGSMSSIVFISSIESRVFEAMRTQPLRFVRKSHLQTDLEEYGCNGAMRYDFMNGFISRMTFNTLSSCNIFF